MSTDQLRRKFELVQKETGKKAKINNIIIFPVPVLHFVMIAKGCDLVVKWVAHVRV